MTNNTEGRKKTRQALIEKYGGEEGYKAEMRRRASIGGKNSTNRPFRDTPGLAKRAGSVKKKK